MSGTTQPQTPEEAVREHADLLQDVVEAMDGVESESDIGERAAAALEAAGIDVESDDAE